MLELLRKHESVIAGSATLLMLFPNLFTPGNIDIIVPGKNAVRIVVELCRVFHYNHANPERERTAYNSDAQVVNIHKLAHVGDGKNLNIIEARADNFYMMKIILSYQSTHIMNAITPTGFLCAYPELTLEKRGLTNISTKVDLMGAWWRKQRRRGFDIRRTLKSWPEFDDHDCTTHPSCPHTARQMRDSHMMFRSILNTGDDIKHTLHYYSTNMVFSISANCGTRRGEKEGDEELESDKSFGYVWPAR